MHQMEADLYFEPIFWLCHGKRRLRKIAFFCRRKSRAVVILIIILMIIILMII